MASSSALHVVTGAFGYSGRYIAMRLLAAGHRVRTLTNSPAPADPLAGRVEVRPLSFDDPAALADSLRGAEVLYNTYWVRFNHRHFTHAQAVQNTRRLFAAGVAAGVRRIVHVSITNPSADSPFVYFRGKADLEQALRDHSRDSGLSHAILRPAVLFGGRDILLSNIAWGLRRFPVFPIFGDGLYRIQPIHVDDLAALAVEHGAGQANCALDAIGPETFTYRDLVQTIGQIIQRPRPLLHVPPRLGYAMGKAIGWWMNDVFITWEEIGGLMAGLLSTNSPPAGTTSLTAWATQNADLLGVQYASELARRRR